MPVLHDTTKLNKLLELHNIKVSDAVARGKFYKEYFDWDTILSEYESGMSMRDLCRKYEVISYDVMRSNLVDRGAEMKKFSNKGTQQYSFYKEEIELITPKGAYFLGWLFADGHVAETHIMFQLQNSDARHLAYVTSLVSNKPLSEKGVFTYHDVELCKYLMNAFGLHNRKSFDSKFKIPKKLLSNPYFLLGFLEGDGHISSKHPILNFLVPKNSVADLEAVIGVAHRSHVLNAIGLTRLDYVGQDYFRILNMIYSNTKAICPLARKANLFVNQLDRSMNGRTSPYKGLAKQLRYSPDVRKLIQRIQE